MGKISSGICPERGKILKSVKMRLKMKVEGYTFIPDQVSVKYAQEYGSPTVEPCRKHIFNSLILINLQRYKDNFSSELINFNSYE
jgi:hypothetical protein